VYESRKRKAEDEYSINKYTMRNNIVVSSIDLDNSNGSNSYRERSKAGT